MPELTNSRVGSFCGTSGLEGTMVWPLERKYSRKLERISFDFTRRFYCTAEKPGTPAGRPGNPLPCLCVDAPVFQEPGAHRSHGALVRRGQLLQRAPGVECGQQLAVLFLAPGLAGLGRHLLPAPLEALDALERRGRLVQCPHDLRALVSALGREHFAALRIDPVRQRPHDRQCLCLIHFCSPPFHAVACKEERGGTPLVYSSSPIRTA